MAWRPRCPRGESACTCAQDRPPFPSCVCGIARPGQWRRQTVGTLTSVPRFGYALARRRRGRLRPGFRGSRTRRHGRVGQRGHRIHLIGPGRRADGGRLGGPELDWVRADARRGRPTGRGPFELDGEFGGGAAPRHPMDASDPVPDESRLQGLGRLQAGANTTLGVIACNAALTTVECKRVAIMGPRMELRARCVRRTRLTTATRFLRWRAGRSRSAATGNGPRTSRASVRRPPIVSRAPSPGPHSPAAREPLEN